MPRVVERGEVVYNCTVCNRKVRVPANRRGLDVLHYCIITAGCKGKLNRVVLTKDIMNTPTLTPSVTGLQDWFQRKLLYTHTQVINSTEWIISHKLNGNASVFPFVYRLVDGELQLVEGPQPIISIIDSNTTKLTFEQEETGIAQLVLLSSSPTENITPAVSSTILPKTQISTDVGELTFATLASDPLIDITITFNIAGQGPVTITYKDVDNVPSTSSPWVGANKIFANGKTYTVRSLNIMNHKDAITFFATGEIPPQGSNFYVAAIDGILPTSESILTLGATYPFGTIDRIYDKYVDISKENATSANVIYSFGKVYALNSAILSLYPLITVV